MRTLTWCLWGIEDSAPPPDRPEAFATPPCPTSRGCIQTRARVNRETFGTLGYNGGSISWSPAGRGDFGHRRLVRVLAADGPYPSPSRAGEGRDLGTVAEGLEACVYGAGRDEEIGSFGGRSHGGPGGGKLGAREAVRPFESPAELTPLNKIDKLVLDRLKKSGARPAPLSSDAVFVRRAYLDVIGTLPTAEEARAVPADNDPEQAQRADRPPARAGGVCGLLGDEVERSAAGQGGVPHQPVAQRRPGLSSLDSDQHPGEHALRPVRPGDAHRQRQQLPRAAGELLPGDAEPGAGGHRADRGADVHGRRGRTSGRRSGWPAWPPSSRRSATSTTAEWKEEIVFFDPGKTNRRDNGSADRRRPSSRTGRAIRPVAGPGPARGVRRLAD